MQDTNPEAYTPLLQSVFAGFKEVTEVTEGKDVAEAVWRAATEPSAPLKIAAGADAVAWATASGDDRFVTPRSAA